MEGFFGAQLDQVEPGEVEDPLEGLGWNGEQVQRGAAFDEAQKFGVAGQRAVAIISNVLKCSSNASKKEHLYTYTSKCSTQTTISITECDLSGQLFKVSFKYEQTQ